MPQPAMPEDLVSMLKDMNRRLSALETAPRLANSEFPWNAALDTPTFNTTSATPVDASPAGPSVTLKVSSVGRVIVTASAYIGLNSDGQFAFASLWVDGVNTITSVVGFSLVGTIGSANVTSTRTMEVSPGEHTFLLKYQVSGGGNANFSSRSLVVQPY